MTNPLDKCVPFVSANRLEAALWNGGIVTSRTMCTGQVHPLRRVSDKPAVTTRMVPAIEILAGWAGIPSVDAYTDPLAILVRN